MLNQSKQECFMSQHNIKRHLAVNNVTRESLNRDEWMLMGVKKTKQRLRVYKQAAAKMFITAGDKINN